MRLRDWFFPPESPLRAVYEQRTLTRRSEVVTSRLYLDHLYRVLAARSGDNLLLRPAFAWYTVSE